MKIKLDENLSRHLKALLKIEGHEVATASDEGLLGKSDIAGLEGCVVVVEPNRIRVRRPTTDSNNSE